MGIRAALAWLLIVTGQALAAPTGSPTLFDAYVSVQPAKGEFPTVMAALAAAPAGAAPYRIHLADGHYHEKVTVERDGVSLVGESRQGTVLSFDAYAGKKAPDGSTYGTSGSATVTVRGRDFRASSLGITNAFDYRANERLADDDPARERRTQAVAVLLDTGSDRALFEDVDISGFQDTLYTKTGRSLFVNSRISGTVDFIFGGGTAVFYRSEILSRRREMAGKIQGYITAPSTDRGQAHGLVFFQSRLLREPGVPDGTVALGRPWHPTRSFPDGRYADPEAIGMTVLVDCYMDVHVLPEGWVSMSGTAREPGERVVFEPDQARFFEYRSYGPGAAVHPGRRLLDSDTAAELTPERVLGPWVPWSLTETP